MICVMLVSYLEIYIEDVWIEMGRKNPSIIKDLTIDAKRLMETASMEDLHLEVLEALSDWSRAHVPSGGPKKWAKKLHDMGARTVDKAAIAALQELYDVRNLIVHQRSTVSRAHERDYPKSGLVAGKQLIISYPQLKDWLSALTKLAEGIEAFSARYAVRKDE